MRAPQGWQRADEVCVMGGISGKKYIKTLQHCCLLQKCDDNTAVNISDSKICRRGFLKQLA